MMLAHCRSLGRVFALLAASCLSTPGAATADEFTAGGAKVTASVFSPQAGGLQPPVEREDTSLPFALAVTQPFAGFGTSGEVRAKTSSAPDSITATLSGAGGGGGLGAGGGWGTVKVELTATAAEPVYETIVVLHQRDEWSSQPPFPETHAKSWEFSEAPLPTSETGENFKEYALTFTAPQATFGGVTIKNEQTITWSIGPPPGSAANPYSPIAAIGDHQDFSEAALCDAAVRFQSPKVDAAIAVGFDLSGAERNPFTSFRFPDVPLGVNNHFTLKLGDAEIAGLAGDTVDLRQYAPNGFTALSLRGDLTPFLPAAAAPGAAIPIGGPPQLTFGLAFAQPGIGSFTLKPVPEPAGLLLAGIGASSFGLALVFRRRTLALLTIFAFLFNASSTFSAPDEFESADITIAALASSQSADSLPFALSVDANGPIGGICPDPNAFASAKVIANGSTTLLELWMSSSLFTFGTRGCQGGATASLSFVGKGPLFETVASRQIDTAGNAWNATFSETHSAGTETGVTTKVSRNYSVMGSPWNEEVVVWSVGEPAGSNRMPFGPTSFSDFGQDFTEPTPGDAAPGGGMRFGTPLMDATGAQGFDLIASPIGSNPFTAFRFPDVPTGADNHFTLALGSTEIMGLAGETVNLRQYAPNGLMALSLRGDLSPFLPAAAAPDAAIPIGGPPPQLTFGLAFANPGIGSFTLKPVPEPRGSTLMLAGAAILAGTSGRKYRRLAAILAALGLCFVRTVSGAEFHALSSSPGLAGFSVTDVSADGRVLVGAQWGLYGTNAVKLSTVDGQWSTVWGCQDVRGFTTGPAYYNSVSGDGSIIVGGAGESYWPPGSNWNACRPALAFGNWSGPRSDPGGALEDLLGVSADGTTIVGIGTTSAGRQLFRARNTGEFTWLGRDSKRTGPDVSADGGVVISDNAIWTPADGWKSLGLQASGLTLDGSLVVGQRSGRPAIWTAASGVLGLPLPDGAFGAAIAVAGDGSSIVIRSNDGNRGFIWDSVHGTRDLLEAMRTEQGLSEELHGWSSLIGEHLSGDGSVLAGSGSSGTWYAKLDPLQTPQFGDANSDGTVDLADFGMLETNFGAGHFWYEGDFTGDYKVELADFGFLKANFGKTAAAAPEPATWLLALLAALGCGAILRSHNSSCQPRGSRT